MRSKMNGMMKIPTEKPGDVTYKDVSSFMVPGMFDPNDKEKWALFLSHRPYCVPGYKSKAPAIGKKVPDGPLLSLEEGGPSSTLLAEAKKLAQATGASKVIISFDSVTCPFWRAYAAEDLYRAVPGIPTLHVCIREAHPLDEFDAEGANTSGPLQLTREFNKHKTLSDRRASAKEAKALISKFEPGEITMFVDGMDDKLEALYEARPWRQYVIEAATGKMIDAIGLTPFQMEDKIAAIKAACA
uniref:Thioredoxin domain-containing protein n=1 Tax=Calcidiscus leptoporus TaxID=127549 RepID=A0A7S0JED3_9EUKA|mmetsp:Transcript_52362/g.120362  ORF Transcript_52362/g.120362 Transcript_52362/m.120362 type:complete len:243 (+) Transcript_52362:1-729(+)